MTSWLNNPLVRASLVDHVSVMVCVGHDHYCVLHHDWYNCIEDACKPNVDHVCGDCSDKIEEAF